VSVSKLEQQHGINADMLLKWRRDLGGGLLTDSGTQPVQPLPVVVSRTSVGPTFASATIPAAYIEIVIADAAVRVGADTDAALLQLVLHALGS
jgi:transposase